jgi:phage shock protein PspC (stress-responsive transcriptional regulator)
MSSTQQSGGVEDTLRDFWATRPVRPRRGGKVAGVSAAIGERYGVDPILIRVAFVVGAFYSGAGITLYLLAWLLFPKEAEPRPGDTAPRGEPAPAWLAVVLVLLLIPGVFWLTDSLAILAVAAGLAALYGLHVTRGDRPQEPTGTTAPAEAPPGPIAAEPAGENTWVYPGAEARQEPPTWDPLGAVPQAWDLPEPPPEVEPEPPRHHYRWYNPLAVLVTLVFGVFAVSAFGPSTALAAMLGLAGLFLIGGAFLRVGRWPALLAVPLAALAMFFAIFSAYPQRATDLSMGDLRVAPRSAEELQRNYGRSAGIVDLDLSELPVAEGQTLRTAADVGTGQIQVRVPPEVDVWSVCRTDLGEVDCLGATADGHGASRTKMDEGADGPGGGRLELYLTAGVGRVEVIRD